MRLYFVRHGESEANLLNQFSNKDFEKHPLTARGREQAQQLSEKLRETKLTEICTSPLARARQTAEILGAPHRLAVQIAPPLREHDAGDLEGRADPAAWQAFQTLFETWILKQQPDARIPNGESLNDMRARFAPFLTGIVEKHANSDANVVLVGHAGIFHGLLPLLLSNVSYAFAYQHILGNTALVLAEPRDEALFCLEWDGIAMNGPV